MGGGISRSIGRAHGATSRSNSLTWAGLCARLPDTCELYIHPIRPIGFVYRSFSRRRPAAANALARSALA